MFSSSLVCLKVTMLSALVTLVVQLFTEIDTFQFLFGAFTFIDIGLVVILWIANFLAYRHTSPDDDEKKEFEDALYDLAFHLGIKLLIAFILVHVWDTGLSVFVLYTIASVFWSLIIDLTYLWDSHRKTKEN